MAIKTKSSRREFMRNVGLGAAALGAAACAKSGPGASESGAPIVHRSAIRESWETDVLVVGGGPSGIGAAIGAARQGVQVLALENLGFFGGVAARALGMPINQVRPKGKPRSSVHELLIAKLKAYGPQAFAMGEEKDILILFSDIQGFTPFAESLLPYDVIYCLNLHFREMGEIVNHFGGHIDNYMGDGFMALFEGKVPEEAALRAVRAGLAMLKKVEEGAPYLEELYHRSFTIRLGLHYGKVVAGNLGHPGHTKKTVVGDAVNLANRIESANKKAGTNFLISEDTYALVRGQVLVGKRTQVNLKGKSGRYRLYEILGVK